MTILAAGLLFEPMAALADWPSYALKELGALGGSSSVALDLNEAGSVVGNAITADGHSAAFLYTDGRMIDLNVLGATAFGTTDSEARAINAAGDVIGVCFCTRDVSCEKLAFLYSHGQMIDLGTLGGSFAAAYAINDRGQVTGESTTAAAFQSQPFLFDGHEMINLNTIGALRGVGIAINNAGEVAGVIDLDSFTRRAFLYSHGQLIDLGTLDGRSSEAVAINESGQVVGSSTRPFLYSDGHMIDLGTLGGATGHALAINSAGQITGDAAPAVGQRTHAFLYSDGQMIDLGGLGGPVITGDDSSRGEDINESGDITGHAFTASRVQHGFLYSSGRMRDLNDLVAAKDFVIIAGLAINDRRQIVGTGAAANVFSETAFLATPISLLFSRLLRDVIGVGPGNSLAHKVRHARAYYQAQDRQATCAMLQSFSREVRAQRGKKIGAPLANRLIADAREIASAIDCT